MYGYEFFFFFNFDFDFDDFPSVGARGADLEIMKFYMKINRTYQTK